MQIKWTEIKISKLKSLIEKGYSIKQIANEFGTSYATISSTIKRKKLNTEHLTVKKIAKHGTFKQQAIDKANFSKKKVKRRLEAECGELVTQKGGWFGIPGPALKEHWEVFSCNLRELSPFVVFEEDYNRYKYLKKTLHHMGTTPKKVITIQHIDMLTGLKQLKAANKNPRVPVFSYGHLDFCKTTNVLLKDNNLFEMLNFIAKWNNTKNIFYLDISASTRCKNSIHKQLMEEIIPVIFSINGWKVTNGRKETNYCKIYREPHSCPMVNALYKMERINPIKSIKII